ncbi:MAG: amidohydrolase [Dehalococcoidia bacterium]|nr:amidohydrolase [Dehalococcoidia bacterium]
MPDHAAWLDQVQEEVIEPERRICDPHHHLWDRNGNRYLLDELLADTGSGHNVVSTVFVECLSTYRAGGPEELRPVGETEFVQGVAAMSASGGYGPMRACSAIIGRATLSMGAAAGAVLDAHIAASPNRFRGIRDAAGWDPSPDVRNSHTNPPEHLFLDAQFREGMKELEKRSLVFEAWHYHTQIPELTSLARAFPGVTIVLDHFGGPLGIGPYEGRADEVFENWRENVDDLATCPNVVAKLGGINMPINGFGWHKRPVPPTSDDLVAATRRYYEHTIDRFGPGRCMFESNFPVDRESCSYGVLWNAFKKLAAGHPEDEKDAMFYGTATRVYRIEEEG